MLHIRLLSLACCVALLAGCDRDVVPSVFERHDPLEKNRASDEAREQEAVRNRLDVERQAFALRIYAVRTVLSNETESIEGEIARAAADRTILSDRMKALTGAEADAAGKGHAAALLSLLGDDVVNDMAVRYLGRDFRLARLGLKDAMANLSAEKRQMQAELAANKSRYDEQLKDTRAESSRAKDAAQRSLEDQRKAIGDLEQRREKLRRKLQFVSATERKRLELELSDINTHLRQLRSSYDGMRAQRDATYERSKAGRESERMGDAAARQKKDEDERVRRRFKNLKDGQELVLACEASTVRALETALKAQAEKSKGRLSAVKNAQAYVSAVSRDVEKLDFGSLKRASSEIDKVLVKAGISN